MNDELLAICRRASEGSSTYEDAKAAARMLPTLAGSDAYDALFVVGRAGDARLLQEVEPYFDQDEDPMLSRLALQIIASEWGVAENYVDVLERFASGVQTDLAAGGLAQSAAISALGELTGANHRVSSLKVLLDLYEDDQQSDAARREAYEALMRAFGRSWSEVPGTASESWRDNPDQGLLERVRARVAS
jgi:hypothetical protein